MPTYALLGATGSTGSAVLRCLRSGAAPPNLTLNIFIRSKAKLLRLFPDLESTTKFKLNITESIPEDTVSLQKAISGAEIIFQCIAANDVTPKVSVAKDTVTALLKAMKGLYEKKGKGKGYVTPTVLQLRAAPLNETFSHQSPWLIESFIKFALHYTYSDIVRGCDLLVSAKEETPDLLDYIFVDTGAVHDADGTECTGHKLTLDGPLAPAISYADTGAGICEMAKRVEEFKGKGVGIVATGKVNLTWSMNAYYIAMGVKARIIG